MFHDGLNVVFHHSCIAVQNIGAKMFSINGITSYQASYCHTDNFHDYSFPFQLSDWSLFHDIRCRDTASLTQVDAKGPGSLM